MALLKNLGTSFDSIYPIKAFHMGKSADPAWRPPGALDRQSEAR
jgi:hypothetical protein